MNDTKYQPQTINEVVFGNDESRLLIEDIVSGVLPFPFEGKTGILLYGTFGTGKQRWLAYCPKLLNKDRLDSHWLLTLTFSAANKGTRALSLPTH